MSNLQIRKMTYDDIPLICKAENDEAEFLTSTKN